MNEAGNNKQAFCWDKDVTLGSHAIHLKNAVFFFLHKTLKDEDIGFDGVSVEKCSTLCFFWAMLTYTAL